MGRLNWGKRAYAVVLLCAATAIALPAQTSKTPHPGSITPVVPNETVAPPAQTFTTLHSFGTTEGGEGPVWGLVQATDGNLYGTTYLGGANGQGGTVFKITPSGTLTTLYSFCSQSGCADGSYPGAALVQATDGNFYGTTQYGGANNNSICQGSGCGTIFKITSAGTLTTLYSFCSQSACADGRLSFGLVQATDGNFYGTTEEGGANGQGTVFKVTPIGTLTTLYSFCSQSACADGAEPSAGLVQATDGNFFGTTQFGGANNNSICYSFGCGSVFQITPAGALTTLYSFCSQSGCTDGANPSAGLVQATDGNFYGTTYNGGTSTACSPPCGNVFEISPGGTLQTLHSFDYSDGAFPEGGLLQATNGAFYGTTPEGGTGQDGTVFSLAVGLGPFVKTQPTSGKVGAAVKILGTNLTGATRVMFNGDAVVFTVVSSSLITTSVPAGATTGPVEVVTPSHPLLSNVPFQVAPSFSPESTGGEERE